MGNFWTNELDARRAGRRHGFRGDNESIEAFAARRAPVTAAQERDVEEFAAFQAQRAAQRAAEAAQAAAQVTDA